MKLAPFSAKIKQSMVPGCCTKFLPYWKETQHFKKVKWQVGEGFVQQSQSMSEGCAYLNRPWFKAEGSWGLSSPAGIPAGQGSAVRGHSGSCSRTKGACTYTGSYRVTNSLHNTTNPTQLSQQGSSKAWKFAMAPRFIIWIGIRQIPSTITEQSSKKSMVFFSSCYCAGQTELR